MCRTNRFEAKEYSKPQHKNARPYKRDKYKHSYKDEEAW